MKPVAIFRHSAGEGPGYFATFLDRHGIPWQLVCIDAGALPPSTCEDFSGLCFMGGPMSVNDDLPWLPPTLELIRGAVAVHVPVIGHCLGGQLISKALGGVITRNPVKELGWGEVTTTDTLARDWLGDLVRFEAFHWHGETFELPPGARQSSGSKVTSGLENRAFISHHPMEPSVPWRRMNIRWLWSGIQPPMSPF